MPCGSPERVYFWSSESEDEDDFDFAPAPDLAPNIETPEQVIAARDDPPRPVVPVRPLLYQIPHLMDQLLADIHFEYVNLQIVLSFVREECSNSYSNFVHKLLSMLMNALSLSLFFVSQRCCSVFYVIMSAE